VYLQTRSTMAFHVHLQTRSILASKCISKLARLRRPTHQQNVNLSGSSMQPSQTLRLTSQVFPITFRCSQTLLELSNVLSDSARALADAPESTGSNGGTFGTVFETGRAGLAMRSLGPVCVLYTNPGWLPLARAFQDRSLAGSIGLAGRVIGCDSHPLVVHTLKLS